VPYRGSRRLWIAQLGADVPDLLATYGRPITYPYVHGQWPISMYQTVYAGPPGSAEMPSAGRAFSPDVLEQLAHRGIEFMTLTLHTGVASLEGHEQPYAEEYWIPRATAFAVESARADGRRVIAVGTTVVRALESAADEGDGEVIATHAWTEKVITPERGVRVVDSLLTGFHEPKASHLDMLEAIAGRCHLETAYRAALDGQYLWHEFGDLHLILRA
jgi:S-adenosylmethionine:tRNA ribosyltransferase-isomerase